MLRIAVTATTSRGTIDDGVSSCPLYQKLT